MLLGKMALTVKVITIDRILTGKYCRGDIMRFLKAVMTKAVFSLLVTQISYGGGDVTAPKVVEILQAEGVEQTYSRESYDKLELYLENEIAQKSGDEDKEGKRFYKYGLGLLRASADQEEALRAARYYVAIRIIYSVMAQESLGRNAVLENILSIPSKIVTTMPYVTESEFDRQIGPAQAALEARFLVDINSKRYLSEEELAQLSYRQIADLDISSSHPAWHTEEYMKTHKDTWGDLERFMEKSLKKDLKKKYGEEVAQKYKLQTASKVLLFEGIKSSATSPKVDAKDLYGNKWKLKWGNEVQVEPIANRLYMKVGAKFADLVYAKDRGLAGTVLILGDLSKTQSCEENVADLEMLKGCLLSSVYKFNLEPYIFSSGIITAENKNKILQQSAYLGEESKTDSLIGRVYVTFHESMVEFKNSKAIKSGGPIPGSFFGVEFDRVARSLMIFNMWIRNNDSKDENSKNILIEDLINEGDNYLEYQHDFGASLGSAILPGQVNKLKDRDFLELLENEQKINFEQFLLYRPKAWTMVTFADGVFMAKKMASLKKTDFEEVFSHSKWPDFLQKTFVRKMMARRNRIAEIFHVTDLLPKEERLLEDINISISFKTSEERNAVCQKYAISINELEKTMKEAGILKERGGISTYQDNVVSKNQLRSCQWSLIVNLLEKGANPSGIQRRVERFHDDKPLAECVFLPKAPTDGADDYL